MVPYTSRVRYKTEARPSAKVCAGEVDSAAAALGLRPSARAMCVTSANVSSTDRGTHSHAEVVVTAAGVPLPSAKVAFAVVDGALDVVAGEVDAVVSPLTKVDEKSEDEETSPEEEPPTTWEETDIVVEEDKFALCVEGCGVELEILDVLDATLALVGTVLLVTGLVAPDLVVVADVERVELTPSRVVEEALVPTGRVEDEPLRGRVDAP